MRRDAPTLGGVIRRFGTALLHRRGAKVTPAQRAVLSTLARCHTAALGGHLYRCDECGVERTAYNSCGNRHCPSCLGHKSAAWLTARAAELLPVPYYHVVFTVPAEVAELALGNKKIVYSILFRAASETLLEAAANPEHLGATLGVLAILHTWTQTLLHHPHVHCIVPGGGLSADGKHWVNSREQYLLPISVLKLMFRGKFLDYLADAARAGMLQFAGTTAGLAEPRQFNAFLQTQRRKDWVVYVKPPFGSPEQVLKYLARYTHRVAISDRRLVSVNDDTVTFSYRDRAHGDRQRTMTLDGVEFLRRFLLHLLPTSFVRIRYFGLFANRVRAENLARCKELLTASGRPGPTIPSPPVTPAPSKLAPQDCPSCASGRLLWIANIAPAVLTSTDALPPPRKDTS
jgi:hypothetical protein